jgi:predicted component of type VI protein secretion system
MRTRAQWYQAKAEQCSDRAKTAPDPEAKRIYQIMAREWSDLARSVEQTGAEYEPRLRRLAQR